MNLVHASLPAVMFASVAAPICAQGDVEAPLGSRIGRAKPADIPDNVRMSDEDRGRATMYRFANCVVRDAPKKVASYIELKADDAEANSALAKLATDECLRAGELRMPAHLLRGAVFRSLYMRDFEKAPSALAEEAVDFATFLNEPKSANNMQYLVLEDFADCVVRTDFANSDKFVRAEVASKSEKEALAALVPQLGGCFPQGAQVSLNKSVISSALSEAVYREAMAGQANAPSEVQ